MVGVDGLVGPVAGLIGVALPSFQDAEVKAAPLRRTAARPPPGSALGGPPGTAASTRTLLQIKSALLRDRTSCGAFFLGFDYPGRVDRVEGGPASRRSRSASPTRDPVAAHLVLAPMRKTGQISPWRTAERHNLGTSTRDGA